jgi:hypothetical protein
MRALVAVTIAACGAPPQPQPQPPPQAQPPPADAAPRPPDADARPAVRVVISVDLRAYRMRDPSPEDLETFLWGASEELRDLAPRKDDVAIYWRHDGANPFTASFRADTEAAALDDCRETVKAYETQGPEMVFGRTRESAVSVDEPCQPWSPP